MPVRPTARRGPISYETAVSVVEDRPEDLSVVLRQLLVRISVVESTLRGLIAEMQEIRQSRNVRQAVVLDCLRGTSDDDKGNTNC